MEQPVGMNAFEWCLSPCQQILDPLLKSSHSAMIFLRAIAH